MLLVKYKNPIVIISVGLVIFGLYSYRQTDEKMSKVVGVNFEVFGRVQGVFFRKYTQKKAEELSLKGWCMNTRDNTVTGRIEGEKSKIEEMKNWLCNVGSPQSAIDRAEFKNEEEMEKPVFSDFSIRK